MSQLLNYKQQGQGPCVILVHGLFGSLSNLGLLAKDLARDHTVISVDVRNHGLSFHHQDHDYVAMAEDIAQLITHLNIDRFTVIGHSMGGKVAMQLSAQLTQQCSKAIVLDMAPVRYSERHHDNVFAGLKAVALQKPSSRQDALSILAQHVVQAEVCQFLSKSLFKADDDTLAWRFNVDALWRNYEHIIDWQPLPPSALPILFLKGANSDYIKPEYQSAIAKQFPAAKAHIIANTGHWLHAEKPQEVNRAIRRFLSA